MKIFQNWANAFQKTNAEPTSKIIFQKLMAILPINPKFPDFSQNFSLPKITFFIKNIFLDFFGNDDPR